MQFAAAAGLACCRVAPAKSIGEFGDAVRGSNALTGVSTHRGARRPSRGLQLDSHARVLRAVSRFDSTPEELYLELGDARVRADREPRAGSRLTRERARIQRQRSEEVQVNRRQAEALGEELDLPRSTVRRHLRALLDRGVVCREGRGAEERPVHVAAGACGSGVTRLAASDLLANPDALLSRSHLRELGLERRAVDAVFRKPLPTISLPGYARPLIQVRDYRALLARSTFDGRTRVR